MPRLDEVAGPPKAADSGSIAVLCIGDGDFLEAVGGVLAAETDFEIRTEPPSLAAAGRLEGVDCVVAGDESSHREGPDPVTAVRDRAPRLPVVLCTDRDRGDRPADRVADLLDSEWTELVDSGDVETAATLLAARVRRLVAHRRTAALADRATAALDEAEDGLAVVAPDGEFAVVNRSYARQFGHDADALVGRDWRTCYPDAEAARIDSTALEPVRDDWRWTGRCLGRRADGETFTAPTCIVGLADGSFVVQVSDAVEG